jgi:HK97 family phage major capsid protein
MDYEMTTTQTNLDNLTEQRANEWNANGKPLADLAGSRELTTNELRNFDNADKEFTAITSRIETMTRTLEQETQLKAFNANLIERTFAPSSETRIIPTLTEYRALETRAIGTGSLGILLDENRFNAWSDKLRQRSVFLAAGPRTINVSMNSMNIPVVSTSVTMTARDEGTAINSSETGLVQRHLQPVSYGVYTLVNNEAIEESAGVVLDVVSSDLIRTTATTLDTQFFQGVGAASPYRTTGLTNIAGIGNIAVTGAITLAAVLDAQALLEGAGADPASIAYFINPIDFAKLRKLVDTTGRSIMSVDIAATVRPSLFGIPCYVSANVPAKKSLLADMSQVIVGIGADVRLEMSTHAAFASNQTAVRLTTRADLQPLDKAGLVTITTTV